MGDRACASCGAPVAVLADVCPSCGGDPDLRLLELGAGSGRRKDRPSSGGAPRRPRIGWKRWTPIVAVVLVLWGFLALTAGDGDDEEAAEPPAPSTTREPKREPTTSTSRRPRPPRTTTTTIPLTDRAPLLGEATGLTVVLDTGRPRLIDLDTGVLRTLDFGSQVYGAADGRVLLGDDNGLISWWPAPYDGTGAERLYAQRDYGAWLDPDSEVVWAASSDSPTGQTVARAYGHDGHLMAEHRLPVGAWPIGAVGDDLVVAAPGGTFVLDRSGGASMISTGQASIAGDGQIVVTRCEGDLDCVVEVIDPEGEVLVEHEVEDLDLMMGPYGYAMTVSRSGVVAAVAYDGSDATGRGAGRLFLDGAAVDGVGSVTPHGAITWSPDGRWLFVGTMDGGLVVVDGNDRSVVTSIDGSLTEATWRILVLEGISLEP